MLPPEMAIFIAWENKYLLSILTHIFLFQTIKKIYLREYNQNSFNLLVSFIAIIKLITLILTFKLPLKRCLI